MTDMKKIALTGACLVAFAFPALAAGGGDSTPPKPTPTSECPTGKIWDKTEKACIDAVDSRFNDDDKIKAARELAYADRPEAVLAILATVTNPNSDMVLTYKGFGHRKAGRVEEGMSYYRAAIAQNPDNVLARSYMGQALVLSGDVDAARAELTEIVARSGRESWPAFALRQALRAGVQTSY